jgi:hypothetical protein
MKRNISIWVALLALLAAGCGGNVTLDNARPVAVTITFDGSDAHELAPGEQKVVSLSAGSHALVVKDAQGTVLGDTAIQVKEGGLVHAGGDNYVVWRQLYGLQTERKTLLNEDWVMLDSTKFFGDIKVYGPDVLYLEKSWDLGLEEPMPEATAMYITKDYQVESKVFRGTDFVKTYRQMAENMNKPQ